MKSKKGDENKTREENIAFLNKVPFLLKTFQISLWNLRYYIQSFPSNPQANYMFLLYKPFIYSLYFLLLFNWKLYNKSLIGYLATKLSKF